MPANQSWLENINLAATGMIRPLTYDKFYKKNYMLSSRRFIVVIR